jgi:acyl-CoA thioesterase-1
MSIKKDSIILFQGDSITEWGRNHQDYSSLGSGYAMMAAGYFNVMHPELNVKFLNRGIGGNKSGDLVNRWQKDCIDLKPDVVSILVGINDTWRRYDSNEVTTVEEYRENYHYLLSEIKNKLNSKIVICEPFLLPVTEEQKKYWLEDLEPKIRVVKELSKEFNASYIPFNEKFKEASTKNNNEFWVLDGVHPTFSGHALMSKLWLQFIEEI